MTRVRRFGGCALVVLVGMLSGCEWQGVNSLPLPGTSGHGPGAFTIQAQLPDVDNIERNSRVRVGDVTVGNVEKFAGVSCQSCKAGEYKPCYMTTDNICKHPLSFGVINHRFT